MFGSINIISMAFRVTEAVTMYTDRVRQFFYEVMLLAHACPKCEGKLAMVAEGRCMCPECAHAFDPTVAFQRCSDCGGTLKIEVRRYRCTQCGNDVSSRFLFDGLVFDAQYFRQKMAEHRERKSDQRARLQTRLIESRSAMLEAWPADLGAIPGLAEALNSLIAGGQPEIQQLNRQSFDLSRYEGHIQAHLEPSPIGFDEIPPLSEDARLDRVWRFIAIIFMAHAGLIEIRQEGLEIVVRHRETD
ncbi:MAG: hypothetical protein WBE26_03920 [Phycisphaerae bacterium]